MLTRHIKRYTMLPKGECFHNINSWGTTFVFQLATGFL